MKRLILILIAVFISISVFSADPPKPVSILNMGPISKAQYKTALGYETKVEAEAKYVQISDGQAIELYSKTEVDALINSLLTGTYNWNGNNVLVTFKATEALNFTSFTGTLTQSPTGTWGTSSICYAVATKTLAGDGWFEVNYASDTNDYLAIGLSLNNTPNNRPWDYTLNFADANGGYETYGLAYANYSGPQASILGDKLRLKRTGSTVTAEYYRSGSWTIFKTFSAASSATLYIKFILNGGSKLLEPKGYNVQ